MPTSIVARGCIGLHHVMQSHFLHVIICDCVMHPNTRITLVNRHSYKFHTALLSFGPHSELQSESISCKWLLIMIMYSASVNSVNIAIIHILLKTRLLGLHFCRRHYESIFNHFNVISPKATKFSEITQNTGCSMSLRSLILEPVESLYVTSY